jgi:hypothetical protein
VVAEIVSIDMRRKAARISKNKLCRTAEIDRGTYLRLLRLPGSGRADTLVKLGKALDALIEVDGERRHG